MSGKDEIKEQVSKKYTDLWISIEKSNSSDLPTLQDLFEYAIDEYLLLKDKQLVKSKQDYQTFVSNRIIEIAKTYHDRLVMSGTSGFNQKCKCCDKDVNTTTSIEHDSRDYSKDLSVCSDCYARIATYWKENTPNKIPPF